MDICDYKGYDYKEEFWVKNDRRYEDDCEKSTMRRLINALGLPLNTILDAGCGYGRMYSAYQDLATTKYLMDYAQSLIDQAKTEITAPNTHFAQGDMTKMPYDANTMDLILTVRTLHHIEKPELFFKDAHRILTTNGHLIFEIPNQRHIINIAKWILKKGPNPFQKTPIKLSNAYFNFNPTVVLHTLEACGFTVIKTVSTSFLRSAFLKKIVTPSTLVKTDALLQDLLSWVYLTPSVYVVAKRNA